MNCWGNFSFVPPSPGLLEKIKRTKEILQSGENLPEIETADVLDFNTLTLITSLPVKAKSGFPASAVKAPAPVTGTRKALVLLIDFSDKTAVTAQAHYNNLLFSVGTYATGSMRDYYREVSYNKLDVIGAVSGNGGPTAGWYRASKSKAYYTNNNYGLGAYPQNAQKLVEELVDAANPYVDFSQYDNDGDGIVDALIVIAAGSGAEETGNKNDIWSHAWAISPKSVDGVTVSGYFMGPEDGKVGVMAHELGHLLMDYPDLYDYDYDSAGTGSWDLMAFGSWNNGGDTPAHPTCYCKIKSGWITPTVVFNSQIDVNIKPYNSASQAYKLPIGSTGSKEYFLVTNRQKAGFDSYLPGEGLIIEHVDENQPNNDDQNHYLVDIEQADGRFDLNKNVNYGDATDPYPTAANNKFTVDSVPNSKSYGGADSKVSVTNILRSGDDITARLNVGGAAAKIWYYNISILSTFCSTDSMNAWAYLNGVGWRKIARYSTDGSTNMFVMFNNARGKGKHMNVYADGQNIYQAYLLST